MVLENTPMNLLLLTLTSCWWVYLGLFILGITLRFASDNVVKSISVFMVMIGLLIRTTYSIKHHDPLLNPNYTIYSVVLICVGLMLFLFATQNRHREFFSIILATIGISAVAIDDMLAMDPSLTLMTVGTITFLVNDRIKKIISNIFIILPVICLIIGAVGLLI